MKLKEVLDDFTAGCQIRSESWGNVWKYAYIKNGVAVRVKSNGKEEAWNASRDFVKNDFSVVNRPKNIIDVEGAENTVKNITSDGVVTSKELTKLKSLDKPALQTIANDLGISYKAGTSKGALISLIVGAKSAKVVDTTGSDA